MRQFFNQITFRLRPQLLVAALAATSLGACTDLSGLLDIDQLSDEATAEGGAANQIKGRQDIFLEITNAGSPLNGASIFIPASSLPADFDTAIVTIVPALVNGIGLQGSATAGPIAEIRLVNPITGADIALVGPATIRLPHRSTLTAEQILELHVAHYNRLLADWERLELTAAVANGKVETQTLSLSPFAAAISAVTCIDTDGDGYGDGCKAGPDCDDSDANVYEMTIAYADADTDGVTFGGPVNICVGDELPINYALSASGNDCDDADPEVWQTKLGYVDNDSDGAGAPGTLNVCSGETLRAGYVPNGTDCNDSDPDLILGCASCKDVDGDGHWAGCDAYVNRVGPDCDDSHPGKFVGWKVYEDADDDNFTVGPQVDICGGAEEPAGYSPIQTAADCNDGDANAHQLRTLYVDNDGDGRSAYNEGEEACIGALPPVGYTLTASAEDDCDDGNPAVYRLLTGFIDHDLDGFTAEGEVEVLTVEEGPSDQICSGASLPQGYVATDSANDCNDYDPNIKPNATEIRGDGIDNNCDGTFLLPAATAGTHGYFVANHGDDETGTGSATAPFATIARALQTANPANKPVYIASGEYDGGVTPQVPLYGGFNTTFTEQLLGEYSTYIYGQDYDQPTITVPVLAAGKAVILTGLNVYPFGGNEGDDVGILVQGTATVRQCFVGDTETSGDAKAIVNESPTTLFVYDSQIDAGYSSSGNTYGIYNANGSATVIGSYVDGGNADNGDAYAIYSYGTGSSLTVRSSFIYGGDGYTSFGIYAEMTNLIVADNASDMEDFDNGIFGSIYNSEDAMAIAILSDGSTTAKIERNTIIGNAGGASGIGVFTIGSQTTLAGNGIYGIVDQAGDFGIGVLATGFGDVRAYSNDKIHGQGYGGEYGGVGYAGFAGYGVLALGYGYGYDDADRLKLDIRGSLEDYPTQRIRGNANRYGDYLGMAVGVLNFQGDAKIVGNDISAGEAYGAGAGIANFTGQEGYGMQLHPYPDGYGYGYGSMLAAGNDIQGGQGPGEWIGDDLFVGVYNAGAGDVEYRDNDIYGGDDAPILRGVLNVGHGARYVRNEIVANWDADGYAAYGVQNVAYGYGFEVEPARYIDNDITSGRRQGCCSPFGDFGVGMHVGPGKVIVSGGRISGADDAWDGSDQVGVLIDGDGWPASAEIMDAEIYGYGNNDEFWMYTNWSPAASGYGVMMPWDGQGHLELLRSTVLGGTGYNDVAGVYIDDTNTANIVDSLIVGGFAEGGDTAYGIFNEGGELSVSGSFVNAGRAENTNSYGIYQTDEDAVSTLNGNAIYGGEQDYNYGSYDAYGIAVYDGILAAFNNAVHGGHVYGDATGIRLGSSFDYAIVVNNTIYGGASYDEYTYGVDVELGYGEGVAYDPALVLANNILDGGDANEEATGVYVLEYGDAREMTVFNNIFFGAQQDTRMRVNSVSEESNVALMTSFAINSCGWGGCADAAGNMTVNPQLASTADDWNFHIPGGSPAINAGISPLALDLLIPAPDNDIDGETRLGNPDIGADEYFTGTEFEEPELGGNEE